MRKKIENYFYFKAVVLDHICNGVSSIVYQEYCTVRTDDLKQKFPVEKKYR